MQAPPGKTPSQQLQEQLQHCKTTFELSVVDQFRQIALESERLRVRNNELLEQVTAMLDPRKAAPDVADAYGVFRNPGTGTLMVLSNVKQLNKAEPLFTGTFSDCGNYINERARVPKLKHRREILFPEQGLDVIFEDPAVQDFGDVEMKLKNGILRLRAAQGDDAL